MFHALHRRARSIAIAFVGLAAFAAPALAQEITVGLGTSVTSIDPHFHNLSNNIKISMHVFDRLIEQDERLRLRPGLATEWKAIDDTTWEFKLRRGVRFHDGAEFGAEDVAATIKRVAWVPNSPAAFTTYTRTIAETIVVDPYTIRFRTVAPNPLLPVDITSIYITARRHAQTPTADFNDGKATIGTGPFRFVGYVPGERVTLVRNDDYWGPKPHWQRVTLQIVTNNASRVAGLLDGNLQVIEDVPPVDIATLRARPDVTLARARSNRVLFLHMDQFRDQTPFATDKSGAPLPRNPFEDLRVRQAMSKAINREAIVERVMDGTAIPAGDLLAPGFFGVSPRLKPDAFDPDGARRLLAEAGFPNGFAITIHGPSDRYPNDEKVLQAIAPMLTRVGIDTKVIALPWASFITPASHPTYAYSVLLIGNAATTGEASFGLRVQFATIDREKGMGASNRARYSNPRVDEVLARAMRTIDDAKREALLQEVAEIAMADQAIIPLFHQENVIAMRKGLTVAPRADDYMPVHEIRPAAGSP